MTQDERRYIEVFDSLAHWRVRAKALDEALSGLIAAASLVEPRGERLREALKAALEVTAPS